MEDNNKIKPDNKWIIWTILVYVVAAVLVVTCTFFISGCSNPSNLPAKIEYRDSIVYRDRIVHDTATFEIPIEVEKIVTRDTMSHLENKYGESDAVVSGGFLAHSLKTKPQTIKVPVTVEVHDTVVVQKESEVITQEVKVEKELNWWQKFRLGAFWWLVLGLAASLVYIFRKPLLNLIKIVI